MENEYYILAVGQLNLLEHNDIVESSETVRWNNNQTKFVCKTKLGVVDAPFMIPNNKYTHAEIIAEITKPEWTVEI